jgi:hypothetical protein
MALRLGALEDAFLAANVPPEKAAKAAEELVGYESRRSSVDTRLTLLSWMVTFNLALSVAILFRVFTH